MTMLMFHRSFKRSQEKPNECISLYCGDLTEIQVHIRKLNPWKKYKFPLMNTSEYLTRERRFCWNRHINNWVLRCNIKKTTNLKSKIKIIYNTIHSSAHLLTDSVRQLLKLIVRQQEVCQTREFTHFTRNAFQTVFRQV